MGELGIILAIVYLGLVHIAVSQDRKDWPIWVWINAAFLGAVAAGIAGVVL